MKRFLFLLVSLTLLSACAEAPSAPAAATTETAAQTEIQPPEVDRSQLIGVWQGSGSGNGTFLILREDGSGALLSLAPADGGAFTESFYLGYHIAWQVSADTLSWQVLPSVLPGGAVYAPDAPPAQWTAEAGNGLLALSDGEDTEFFLQAPEPVWLTVADYATALADWLIGPDHPDAEALYSEFYAAFAAHSTEE